MCAISTSRMSSSCRSPSIRSTAPGAISRPACSRRPAASARPADFAALVDACHRAGLGVILDWVPGHFPDDAHGLAPLRRHRALRARRSAAGPAPRLGHADLQSRAHRGRQFPASRTRCSGSTATASMGCASMRSPRCSISTTAGRKAAGFRTSYGGRENLEAIEFLRRFNTEVFGRFPDATTVAEESTAWPMVSRPVDDGGLGFGYKWNMGWMNDTLDYIAKDPIYRKHHHHQITFGLLYAFSENFILPLSHDEVVHGKRSILGRMPGDAWQRFANVRAYYGFMFGHPGKKLLFMGSEFAQEQEWQHDHSLDWHLLDAAAARGRAIARARPQSPLPHRARAARARLRGRGIRMAGRSTTPTTACLPGCARDGTIASVPGRGQLHAADPSRLSHPGAVRRRMARSPQHRRRRSMAAAMPAMRDA